MAGFALVLYGISKLMMPSTWSDYRRVFELPLLFGAHRYSFAAVVGVCAVLLGPLVGLTGHLLLRRRLRIGREDPATDEFFKQKLE